VLLGGSGDERGEGGEGLKESVELGYEEVDAGPASASSLLARRRKDSMKI
jgi:hypothetical protein